MKPLLAHVYEPHRVTYPCYVQPKLNGIRALYQNGRFQSRDEIPFGAELLSHLSTPLLSTFRFEVILDGELYVHGWPLQRINAAVTPVRQQPTEDTLKVEYHVFDKVDFTQSFAARQDSFRPRLVELQETKIKWVFTATCTSDETANIVYADFVSDGYEGMMYRLGDCPYTVPKQPKEPWAKTSPAMLPPNKSAYLSDKDNRCWHLLKRKDWQDDEFRCESVIEGEGKYKGTLGALRCWSHNATEGDLPMFFTVGSGLTDAEREHYWANPPIGRLVKVKYLVLSEAGIPLNPTILAIL